MALIAYIGAGHLLPHPEEQGARASPTARRISSAWPTIGRGRASVHDLRTKLDVNDRRMMAIDHHLNSQNDELAREIEALREEK